MPSKVYYTSFFLYVTYLGRYTTRCNAAVLLYMHNIATYEKDPNFAESILTPFCGHFLKEPSFLRRFMSFPSLIGDKKNQFLWVPVEKVAHRMAAVGKQADETNAT